MIMSAMVCLVSLIACIWSVGSPLVYSSLLTNFSFVAIMLVFPHNTAENAPWPYVAQHNRALRIILLAPIWVSWLSRCPWLLSTQTSRPLLVADSLVFTSSSAVAVISSYYVTKDGPEQLICLTVEDKSLFERQANIRSQALNSVYMVHDHFALLFWNYSVQKTRSASVQSNSDSHRTAPSLQASEVGVLPSQDSQTSQQPPLPPLPRWTYATPDGWEGPGNFSRRNEIRT